MKNWSPAKQFNQKLIIECLTEVSTRVNAQMKNLNRIEELEFTAWRGSEERDHEYEMALINKELKAELHRRQKKIEHTILSVVLDKLQALVKINPEQNVNQISNSIKREITSLAYTCIRKYRDDYKYGEIDEKQSHLVRGINFEEIEANIIRAIENCQSPEALIDVERYQFPIEISNLKDIRNRLSLEHGLFDLCSKDPSARSFSQYAYGKYLVEHQIRVGQCGEFTAACIYLLIKESLPKFYKNMQRNDETRLHIEEIVVEYDDENHVF